MAGESFGRYRLLGEIARGGMGIVYRAVDPQMGRDVALKVMSADSDDEVARFEPEIRIAAQLSHPNVVRVHDVGREDGKPYYTMELVEGPSLSRLLERHGKLAPRAAPLWIARANRLAA